ELLVERGEVDDLRADDADVEHVDSRVGQAAGQRRGERRARQPNVPADRDAARVDELGIRAADAISDVLVQLAGNAAAHVVGLEAGDLLHPSWFSRSGKRFSAVYGPATGAVHRRPERLYH